MNYAARTGTTWPLYLAKEGGYYQKYGLDVNLVFAVHPAGIAMVVSGEAAMTNYPLEQAMPAASRDGSLIIVGSQYKKSSFALMAPKTFSSVRELKGKNRRQPDRRRAVQLHRRSAGESGPDAERRRMGPHRHRRERPRRGVEVRTGGRHHADRPDLFQVREQGYKSLANTSDYEDIFAPTVYVFKKATVAANPKLAEELIKAHAEAIKRLYDDKAFAVKTYLKYNPTDDPADVARVYDLYTKAQTYERVPYVPAAAVQYMISHPVDEQLGAQLRAFDFRKVIDNSMVDRLVKEGFFEQLFGPGIKTEEQAKAKLAFR